MNATKVNPVVVGVDGSIAGSRTVRFAAGEALLRGLPLRVVHARTWSAYYGDPASGGIYTAPLPPDAENRRIVDEAVTMARRAHPDLRVSGEVIDGSAAVALVDESEHAALITVGARGRGGVLELMLGSVAVDVVTRARCPVMLVRGEEDIVGTVVVGVDGTPISREALGFAFAEAAARQVPLHAVHAWSAAPNDATAEDDDRQRAERLLESWMSQWQDMYPAVETTALPVQSTDVTTTLVDASAKASLLVVGSRMRGELRARLLGSTAFALAHTSKCPLAIVRASGQHP